MGRIRTIKPDFPQSESMGRVSRDSRLLFILLWTVVDDSGRARGSSRMLASLLFPYDEDAHARIDGWLQELEREECIVRYQNEGSTFLQIRNWLIHQRIDKPTPTKLPGPEESSRIVANPREDSWQEGKGREWKGKESRGKANRGSRLDPAAVLTPEYEDFCRQERPDLDPRVTFERFKDYWISIGGDKGSKLDWFATWRNWVRGERSQKKSSDDSWARKMAALNTIDMEANHGNPLLPQDPVPF